MNTIYAASNATIVGDVVLGDQVSIWYGAVLRGDSGTIVVGDGTNIQDGAMLHDGPVIGKNCTVGHRAIVHGCTVADNCLIGMGAIVLNGAVLEEGCIVGAGAVVTGKTKAPAGSVLLGNPARVVKSATQEQIQGTIHNAQHYIEMAKNSLPIKTL